MKLIEHTISFLETIQWCRSGDEARLLLTILGWEITEDGSAFLGRAYVADVDDDFVNCYTYVVKGSPLGWEDVPYGKIKRTLSFLRAHTSLSGGA